MKKIRLFLFFLYSILSFQIQAQGRGEDPTFITGTGFNAPVKQILLQPDEKILVIGHFTEYNGTLANRIIRLNANGSKDDDFHIGTGFNDTLSKILLQPDGKIWVGGEFTKYNGTAASMIIRLNSDGSVDDNFQIGTGFDKVVNCIALQSDGRILATVSFTSYNGISYTKPIIRLNANGTLDNSFNPDFSAFNGPYSSKPRASFIGVQSSGKIIVGGEFYESDGINPIIGHNFIRLNEDGSLDKSYQYSGNIFQGSNIFWQTAIYLTPNGEVCSGEGITNRAGGYYLDYSSSYRFLDKDGKQYNPLLGANFMNKSQINNFLKNHSGELFFLGGAFCTGNIYTTSPSGNQGCDGELYSRIVKFNADGSLNKQFNAGRLFNNPIISTVAIQPDGKILVGGNFTAYDGFSRNRIIRLIDGFAPLDEESVNKIVIYPNPTSDYLNLVANPNSIWQITDVFGKIVMEGKTENPNSQIDIKSLPQGIYIFHLTDPQGNKVTKRIVKS